jgi:hypothetical protein
MAVTLVMLGIRGLETPFTGYRELSIEVVLHAALTLYHVSSV